MSDFILYISTSIALILVIEGLVYALFPEGVRKMFEMAIAMPPARLRLLGSVMAISGFCVIWLLSAL